MIDVLQHAVRAKEILAVLARHGFADLVAQECERLDAAPAALDDDVEAVDVACTWSDGSVERVVGRRAQSHGEVATPDDPL